MQCMKIVSGVNGWLPARVAQEMIHNRTANIKGGLGNNIALDQVNEFLNNEFKGNLFFHYCLKVAFQSKRYLGNMTVF